MIRSEARKAAILDSALDCIVTIDHEGCITEFNPAAERTFGYRRDEVLGQQPADVIIPPALRGRHRQGFARYLATGEARVLGRRIEMTAVRADGSEFPTELAITRIPLDGPPSFTGYLRDVTERKQSEEELRRSEAFLAEGQQLSRVGSFSSRVATDEIMWSEQLYRIFEIDRDVRVTFEVIGTRAERWVTVYSPARRPPCWRTWRSTVDGRARSRRSTSTIRCILRRRSIRPHCAPRARAVQLSPWTRPGAQRDTHASAVGRGPNQQRHQHNHHRQVRSPHLESPRSV